MDFRNNPHLQARDFTLTDRDKGGNNGAADIMNVDPAYKQKKFKFQILYFKLNFKF